MAWLRQTIAVLWINLQTIPSRLGSSAVAIIGIAGVVIVFISVLSISAGFSAAVNGTGFPDRALILRKGVDTEMTSGIEGMEVRIIREAPGIRHDGDTALASAELSVVIDLPKKSKPDWSANVPMRGIQPVTVQVRNEMRMVEGRMLRFGTNEAIVGKGANSQFVGLNVGDTIVSGRNSWAVVEYSKPAAALPNPKSGVTFKICKACTGASTNSALCWRNWILRSPLTGSTTG